MATAADRARQTMTATEALAKVLWAQIVAVAEQCDEIRAVVASFRGSLG